MKLCPIQCDRAFKSLNCFYRGKKKRNYKKQYKNFNKIKRKHTYNKTKKQVRKLKKKKESIAA